MSDQNARDEGRFSEQERWADAPQASAASAGYQDQSGELSAAQNEPEQPRGMVPARAHRRTKVERGLMRLVATAGIVAVAVVLGAILASQDVAGWIIGLVIGLVTVILAALLWSSREL